MGSSRQQRRRPRARHVATRRPRGRFDGTERWRRCVMRGRRLGELSLHITVADSADQSSSTSCSRRHHGNVGTACRDDHRRRSRAGKAAPDHHRTRAEARQTMTTTMLSSWPSLVSSKPQVIPADLQTRASVRFVEPCYRSPRSRAISIEDARSQNRAR